jgi:hypothetical protein
MQRFVIHATCNDSIERWILNENGNILEYSSRRLETPIEKFFVDTTGEILVSLEAEFIILRQKDLEPFNIFKSGIEIPCDAVLVENTGTKYLLAAYESCLVMVS